MSFLHLDIKFQRSKILLGMFTVLHLLAVSVLFFIDIWLWIKILIFFLIAYSEYRICWKMLLFKASHAMQRIVFSRGDWKILDNAGQSHAVCLLGQSYLSTWLMILHFRDIESRDHHSIVLARDSMDPQIFRRLYVILRAACA